MKSAYDVILRPVLTERAMWLQSKHNQYTFEVPVSTNKIEIKQAIAQLFPDVKVLAINTIRRRGKVRRVRMALGRTPATKRAIVKVAPGQSIELY